MINYLIAVLAKPLDMLLYLYPCDSIVTWGIQLVETTTSHISLMVDDGQYRQGWRKIYKIILDLIKFIISWLRRIFCWTPLWGPHPAPHHLSSSLLLARLTASYYWERPVRLVNLSLHTKGRREPGELQSASDCCHNNNKRPVSDSHSSWASK